MSDKFTLPPPGLFSTEIINLGPIIDPPFIDARDWREHLGDVETRPVSFETRQPILTEAGVQQATELALASDEVRQELDGKRYEVLVVGSRSVDRQTHHPLVIIYNYTDDVVVEATVHLAAATMLEVTSKRYQPALGAAEEQQALDLVRQDGRLPDAGIDVDTGTGLIVEELNVRSPRYGHRLVDLRFGPANRRLPTAFGIVDLTDRAVIKTGFVPQEES